MQGRPDKERDSPAGESLSLSGTCPGASRRGINSLSEHLQIHALEVLGLRCRGEYGMIVTLSAVFDHSHTYL